MAIGVEDLDAAASRQGDVEVGPGDIVLFRTGYRKKFVAERSAASFMRGEPGLSLACCEWLAERDVAAVGSDNWAIEVLPGESPDSVFDVHMVLIRDLGMSLAELLDFEDLTADCYADGVWDFFFVAPPLKITAGLGSPINPLAIK
jgi:kynurenine formamidase